MFSYFSPEARVPADHPLRSIEAHTDRVLKELLGELDALCSETGRPSIPPERLLKGQLLIALYSVRSDRPDARLQHSVPLVPGHESGGGRGSTSRTSHGYVSDW